MQQSCSSLLVSFDDKLLLSKPETAKLVERGSDTGKKKTSRDLLQEQKAGMVNSYF